MYKNTSGQKLTVYVFDSATSLPVTGLSSITPYRRIDGGTVTVLGDTTATEVDNTNAKGYYEFDLTAAETNGDVILFSAKHATATYVLTCLPAVVHTTSPRQERTNTCQTPTSLTTSQAKLDAAASATDSWYNGWEMQIVGGTGIGQVRTVISYVGSTKVVTLDRAWDTITDNTSIFYVTDKPSANVAMVGGTVVDTTGWPDLYKIRVAWNRNAANTHDIYIVGWEKNGVPVAHGSSGATVGMDSDTPTIQSIKTVTGAGNYFAAQNVAAGFAEISSTGVFKFTTASAGQDLGSHEAAIVVVTAKIDNVTRPDQTFVARQT